MINHLDLVCNLSKRQNVIKGILALYTSLIKPFHKLIFKMYKWVLICLLRQWYRAALNRKLQKWKVETDNHDLHLGWQLTALFLSQRTNTAVTTYIAVVCSYVFLFRVSTYPPATFTEIYRNILDTMFRDFNVWVTFNFYKL